MWPVKKLGNRIYKCLCYACGRMKNGFLTFNPVARLWAVFVFFYGFWVAQQIIYNEAIHLSAFGDQLWHVPHWLIATTMIFASLMMLASTLWQSTTMFRIATVVTIPYQVYMGVASLNLWLDGGGIAGIAIAVFLFPAALALVMVGTDVRNYELRQADRVQPD